MERYIDAIIYVRVPDYQIGKKVTVFFPEDKMKVSGVCRRNPPADVVPKEQYACLPANAIIVSNALKEYQAADVVEVVRCKECRYFDNSDKYCCDFLTADEDGFCAWGERRNDGEIRRH